MTYQPTCPNHEDKGVQYYKMFKDKAVVKSIAFETVCGLRPLSKPPLRFLVSAAFAEKLGKKFLKLVKKKRVDKSPLL